MRIAANGLEIEVDDQGPAGAETVLLIMGLGMQLIAWPQELVDLLLARGFRVLRLDNRDVGLSTHLDHLGSPNMAWAGMRYAMHLPVRSSYTLGDMAADTLAVLDALGLKQVHVCGASMGGMIAQHLAARHPERVKTLTLMMTTTGARHLPQPSLHVRRVLLSRPAGRDTASIVAHLERLLAVIGSPGHPPDAAGLRERLTQSVQRSWHPAGTMRHIVAIVADGDRSRMVQALGMPTRVIHGAADPLIPPAAGHHLAQLIAGAQLDLVPGMGHDLPMALLPHFAAGISENAQRAA